MNRFKLQTLILFHIVLIFLTASWSVAGTTGKVAGQITDSETGEPIAGVNVFLEGTTLGAASDEEGFYFIINIPPGTYNLKVEFIGYAEHIISDVKIQTDLTTNVNVALQSEILVTDAVVVVAERPVINKDVAGSQINISRDDIEILPVTTVSEVIGLQAGITSDLGIRGSGSDQVLFVVDGISLRDNRTNDPISEVPLSALQEISVQSGGISAEYNNVRSGVVNVISREGDANSYSGTLTFKIHPPQPKHFGISPYDKNSFILRPYFDPEVAWTGTQNSSWDKYTKRQYEGFEGWNAVSARLLSDTDPTNDLTPEAAKRLFEWQWRKQGDIKDPDYNIDAGFGGPAPFISKDLGDLRFFASYKREQDMYLFELATDALRTESFMLRLTSDLSPTMKLSILGLYSETKGTNISRSGLTSYFTTTTSVAQQIDRTGFTVPWRIYANIYYSRTARYSHTLSAKLTNVVNPSTFWVAELTKVGKNYRTGPGQDRDLAQKYEIVPGFFVDEAPIGYYRDENPSIDGRLAMGGAVSTSRDTSEISSISLKFDITSQIHRNHQLKAGVNLTFNDYDMSFGLLNFFLPEGNTWSRIRQNPFVGSLYLQDKIEFEGFIANLGLILDYYNSRDKWYDVESFDPEFYSVRFDQENEDEFKTKEATQRFTLSPRLSISHPIGENSKLFFNYGYFRQMPTSERQFRIQRTPQDAMEYIGDPTIPLASTISYELGFDQSLFDEYLFRAAAYYKDVTDQEFWVRYINSEGALASVNYFRITNNSYEDIRGFELDLTKRTGKWVTGNINYEYRVGTSGYFGLREIYENPADQRDYLRRQFYQEKPRPRPRIKSYINIHTPKDLGPSFAGQTIFGDWNFTFITRWTSGLWATWNPENIPGIEYNFQWNDFYNLDLRVSKIFPFEQFNVKFFVDVNNLFNFKYFSRESFYDSFDYDFYMKSLHLPPDIAGELQYGYIPGDDNPGDYRKAGVEYVPMEWTRDETSLASIGDPSTRAIYYVNSTKKYVEYRNDEWVEVDQNTLNKILDDKAYIDMPNHTYFTFLNPRSIFLGLSITYNF